MHQKGEEIYLLIDAGLVVLVNALEIDRHSMKVLAKPVETTKSRLD